MKHPFFTYRKTVETKALEKQFDEAMAMDDPAKKILSLVKVNQYTLLTLDEIMKKENVAVSSLSFGGFGVSLAGLGAAAVVGPVIGAAALAVGGIALMAGGIGYSLSISAKSNIKALQSLLKKSYDEVTRMEKEEDLQKFARSEDCEKALQTLPTLRDRFEKAALRKVLEGEPAQYLGQPRSIRDIIKGPDLKK
jgi:hypothetical protein